MDVQVILIVAVYTLIASVLTSQNYWKYTYQVILDTQAKRVTDIYHAVDEAIDPDTFFHINSREDMETELYKENKTLLTDMKNIAGVLYLYTAKVNEDGQFVYVIDGLEEDLDFRYPNDPIEQEIIFKMETALTGVEAMPVHILNTEWGDIFMAYMPFHDEDGSVIGVVGIEFDATESYETYEELQRSTIINGILLIISGVIVSIFLFRRITNPLYLDKHTKDSFTGMRNRNAYEVDLHNLKAKGHFQNLGVIVADINGLKEVNDRLGHSAGDNYIALVSQAILQTAPHSMVSYRTGGDEFVIFVQDTTEEELQKFARICSSRVSSQKQYSNMRCSVACGFTVYDPKSDQKLEDMINRADELMYKEKQRQKDAQER